MPTSVIAEAPPLRAHGSPGLPVHSWAWTPLPTYPAPYLKQEVHLHPQSLWHWGVEVGAQLA